MSRQWNEVIMDSQGVVDETVGASGADVTASITAPGVGLRIVIDGIYAAHDLATQKGQLTIVGCSAQDPLVVPFIGTTTGAITPSIPLKGKENTAMTVTIEGQTGRTGELTVFYHTAKGSDVPV